VARLLLGFCGVPMSAAADTTTLRAVECPRCGFKAKSSNALTCLCGEQYKPSAASADAKPWANDAEKFREFWQDEATFRQRIEKELRQKHGLAEHMGLEELIFALESRIVVPTNSVGLDESFRKLLELNRGALFFKDENSSKEWKHSIADYFYRHGWQNARSQGYLAVKDGIDKRLAILKSTVQMALDMACGTGKYEDGGPCYPQATLRSAMDDVETLELLVSQYDKPRGDK
jgi:hypothetical protein